MRTFSVLGQRTQLQTTALVRELLNIIQGLNGSSVTTITITSYYSIESIHSSLTELYWSKKSFMQRVADLFITNHCRLMRVEISEGKWWVLGEKSRRVRRVDKNNVKKNGHFIYNRWSNLWTLFKYTWPGYC